MPLSLSSTLASKSSSTPSQQCCTPSDSDFATPTCSGSSLPVPIAISIPDHWHPEVETCIANKKLDGTVRSEIIRTLVNLQFKRPTRLDCEEFIIAVVIIRIDRTLGVSARYRTKQRNKFQPSICTDIMKSR